MKMNEKRDDVQKKAKAEAERIVTDAQNMREKIREEIQAEESNLMYSKCAELLENVFEDALRVQFNEVIIDDFINGLQDVNAAHVPHDVEKVELVTSESLPGEIMKKIEDEINSKVGKNLSFSHSVDKDLD